MSALQRSNRFTARLKGKEIAGFYLVPIGLVAIVGIAILLYHTRSGPITSSDSVSYLQGAINIRDGKGYSRFSGEDILVPITHFPPAFSFVMAGMGLVVHDMMDAGRILNAFLFGANIFLLGWLVYLYTRSILASVLGSLLVLSSKGLVVGHAAVMSEALFIFSMLLAIVVFIHYFQNSRRTILGLAGALIALLGLTRYAGLSLIGAFALAIAVFSKENWRRRCADIVLLCLVSLLPIGVWIYRNQLLAGTLANRVAGFYSIPSQIIYVYAQGWTSWLIPSQVLIPTRLRLFISFVGIIAFVLAFMIVDRQVILGNQSIPDRQSRLLPWLLILIIPIYQIALIASTTFLDPTTSPAAATRYLYPVQFLVILLTICILYRLFWMAPGRVERKAASLVYGLVLLAMAAQPTVGYLLDPGRSYGLTQARWNMPDVTKALKKLDPSRPLISNDPQMIYILSGRTAYWSPIWYSSYTQKYLDNFSDGLSIMHDRMKKGAVLVLFKNSNYKTEAGMEYEQGYFAKVTEGLTLVSNYRRAAFYIAPETQDDPLFRK